MIFAVIGYLFWHNNRETSHYRKKYLDLTPCENSEAAIRDDDKIKDLLQTKAGTDIEPKDSITGLPVHIRTKKGQYLNHDDDGKLFLSETRPKTPLFEFARGQGKFLDGLYREALKQKDWVRSYNKPDSCEDYNDVIILIMPGMPDRYLEIQGENRLRFCEKLTSKYTSYLGMCDSKFVYTESQGDKCDRYIDYLKFYFELPAYKTE
jgi:hypothetical protein